MAEQAQPAAQPLSDDELRAIEERAPDGPWMWLIDRSSPRGLRELARGRQRTRAWAKRVAEVLLMVLDQQQKAEHARLYAPTGGNG